MYGLYVCTQISLVKDRAGGQDVLHRRRSAVPLHARKTLIEEDGAGREGGGGGGSGGKERETEG